MTRSGVTHRCVAASLAGALLVLAPGCQAWHAAQLYHAGTGALDAGRFDRAVVLLERAAQAQPRASEIRNHLGIAYALRGDAARAEAAFERAIRLDCDNGAARRNLRALRAGKLGPRGDSDDALR